MHEEGRFDSSHCTVLKIDPAFVLSKPNGVGLRKVGGNYGNVIQPFAVLNADDHQVRLPHVVSWDISSPPPVVPQQQLDFAITSR